MNTPLLAFSAGGRSKATIITPPSRRWKDAPERAGIVLLVSARTHSVQVLEGGLGRVHAACRRDWASRSASDNSLCIRSEGAAIRGLAFLWPRLAQKCILMPDARTAVGVLPSKRAELPLLLLKLCRPREKIEHLSTERGASHGSYICQSLQQRNSLRERVTMRGDPR